MSERAKASWTGRATSNLERSRWVFGLLTLATTILVTPHMLESAEQLKWWAAGGLLLMGASWVISYRRQRVTLLNDLIEAAALNFVMATLNEPAVTFGFVFPMIWFRSLYGSTYEVAFRTLLYELAFLFEGTVSNVLGRPDDPHLVTFMLGGVMGIIACSVAGHRVVWESRARDRSTGRDRQIAEMGTQLLGLTDPAEIRRIAWSTLAEIGRSAPELRVVKCDLVGGELRIDRTVGSFASIPARIDLGLLPGDGGTGPIPVLDQAVARPCVWAVLSFESSGSDPGSHEQTGPGDRLQPLRWSAPASVWSSPSL